MIASRIPLKEAAQGRWRGILPALGLPTKLLDGRHGPCPICEQGRDRFRFDDREGRGTWICSLCGAGDGVRFVELKHGTDFKGAVAMIEPLIGLAPPQIARPVASEADYRRWRNEAWLDARPVQLGDPVSLFLQARVGLTTYPACLRFHPGLEHRDQDGRRSRHPAMLAIVAGPDGRAINLHRTYLTASGSKADVSPPRRMMPGEIPAGAAIQLAPAAEELGIAEGIETALAASALFDMPVWAAISDRILAKWTPPPVAKRIVVFGDCDAGFAGQAAAYALARSIAGRRLADVEVKIPDLVGLDWNDVLRARTAARAAA